MVSSVSKLTAGDETVEKELFELKMDKKTLSVVSLTDTYDDKYYWLNKKPIERLKHMEILRRINYGHGATSGLQRFFEITER